jgi:hypothetical protein
MLDVQHQLTSGAVGSSSVVVSETATRGSSLDAGSKQTLLESENLRNGFGLLFKF